MHFARGYRGCTAADRASTISLAIGTTNRGTQVRDNGYQQGRAFANFVRSITSQVAAAGASGQVTVTGAIDVEMDWNTYGDTREWYLGYDSLSNTTIYNFGDAAGCTQDGSTTACNNGSTQERVWWVSERFALTHPLPEIYTNSGSMARQWYQLARYTDARHSADMVIAGTLTQFGACQQSGAPPPPTTPRARLDPAVRPARRRSRRTSTRPRSSADIILPRCLASAAAPPTASSTTSRHAADLDGFAARRLAGRQVAASSRCIPVRGRRRRPGRHHGGDPRGRRHPHPGQQLV